MQDLNKIIQDLSAYYDDVGIWYETYAEDIKKYLSDSENGIKLMKEELKESSKKLNK